MAGKLFHEMLEQQKVYVASWQFRASDTHYGTQGHSATNNIIPSATVMEKIGRLIKPEKVR